MLLAFAITAPYVTLQVMFSTRLRDGRMTTLQQSFLSATTTVIASSSARWPRHEENPVGMACRHHQQHDDTQRTTHGAATGRGT